VFSRLGLRSRMAVSYVVISGAAVLIAETILLILVAYQVAAANRSAEQADSSARQVSKAAMAQATARSSGIAAADARSFATAAARISAARPPLSGQALLTAVARRGFPASGVASGDVQILAAPNGRVVLSGSAAYPAGSQLPVASGGSSASPPRLPGWTVSPVVVPRHAGKGGLIGYVYVQVLSLTAPPVVKAGLVEGIGWWLSISAVVLVLLIPVGALFGLLTTGRLIRRIQRLAEGAMAVAGGDLQFRIPTPGRDEVGRLEKGFNQMAGQLEAAVRAERAAAGAQARRGERARIARELHDSISQDLFSSSLLAGALRKALPDGTQPHSQAQSLERALESTMREMRALLLELRPVILEDAGLVAALRELCEAYEVRLGIRISADISDLELEPDAEHVVLRVAQEALGNAARHAEAHTIGLSVTSSDDYVTVRVCDDGQGFDPARLEERHGMGIELMRERVTEFGGTLEVRSLPGKGTDVRAYVPLREVRRDPSAHRG
jgi:signal transduction histidine kinase